MTKSIILPSRKVKGFPSQVGLSSEKRLLETDDIKSILKYKWREDCYFVQYEVNDSAGPQRYNKKILDTHVINMCVIAFDVDSPAKKSLDAGAVDAWWESERPKIRALMTDHPGGHVWRTKGGWRGVWYTSYDLTCQADGVQWRKDYLAVCVYLEQTYGIVADTACSDWNRLHRVPFGIREDEPGYRTGEPIVRETIGELTGAFRISSVITEENIKEARRRHIGAWKDPRPRDYVGADEAAGVMYLGQSVWERILGARGAVLKSLGPGKLAVRCPNEKEHTSSGSDSSTILYAPGPGDIYGHIHCSHSHCEDMDFFTTLQIPEDEWNEAISAVIGECNSSLADSSSIVATTVELTAGRNDRFEDTERRVVSTLTKDPRNGLPAAIPENVTRILACHPSWAGSFAYDQFKNVEIWRNIPLDIIDRHKDNGCILDADTNYIQDWLLKGTHDRPSISCSIETVRRGISGACAHATFDSLEDHVLNYSVKYPWDGVSRLDTWLIDYAGAEDNILNRCIGKIFLVSMIARALDPGCVSDHMVILEGDQGIGKNYILDIMFGDYIVVSGGMRFSNVRFTQRLSDAWCVHDEELTTMLKEGEEEMKAWITERNVKFKKAYDRDFTTVKRRFNVVGTTNSNDYLRENQNRRYLPIKLHKLHHDKLKEVAGIIWSEAVAYYQTGYNFRITQCDHNVWDLLGEVHEEKKANDPLIEKIEAAINSDFLPPFKMHSLMSHLGLHVRDMSDVKMQKIYGKAMRDAGLYKRTDKIWDWPREQHSYKSRRVV